MRGKVALLNLVHVHAGITPACAGKRKPERQSGWKYWDHPCMCGEKTSFRWVTSAIIGSPPRMRGKGCWQKKSPTGLGITPAYAGKRACLSVLGILPADHPRTCGEKLGFPISRPTELGSPPHVRGKGFVERTYQNKIRITPACAGKRQRQPSTSCDRQDHPRTCGEKAPFRYSITCASGSPPRMRGKDVIKAADGSTIGITPAYAGKSGSGCDLQTHRWDHPRMCGEKDSIIIHHRKEQGSPPRMREKGLLTILTYMYFRITPAHAGKSSCSSADNSIEQDHPRVCGEKSAPGWRSWYAPGSPPHVRGKEQMLQQAGRVWGITPACAGKSAEDAQSQRPGKDHPRMCGEKLRVMPIGRSRSGSPPHVRGKVAFLP